MIVGCPSVIKHSTWKSCKPPYRGEFPLPHLISGEYLDYIPGITWLFHIHKLKPKSSPNCRAPDPAWTSGRTRKSAWDSLQWKVISIIGQSNVAVAMGKPCRWRSLGDNSPRNGGFSTATVDYRRVHQRDITITKGLLKGVILTSYTCSPATFNGNTTSEHLEEHRRRIHDFPGALVILRTCMRRLNQAPQHSSFTEITIAWVHQWLTCSVSSLHFCNHDPLPGLSRL